MHVCDVGLLSASRVELVLGLMAGIFEAGGCTGCMRGPLRPSSPGTPGATCACARRRSHRTGDTPCITIALPKRPMALPCAALSFLTTRAAEAETLQQQGERRKGREAAAKFEAAAAKYQAALEAVVGAHGTPFLTACAHSMYC